MLVQPATITTALDCVTWDEIVVRSYDAGSYDDRETRAYYCHGPVESTMLVLGPVKLGVLLG